MPEFKIFDWENEITNKPLVDLLTDEEIGFLLYALEIADENGEVKLGNIKFRFQALEDFEEKLIQSRGGELES